MSKVRIVRGQGSSPRRSAPARVFFYLFYGLFTAAVFLVMVVLMARTLGVLATNPYLSQVRFFPQERVRGLYESCAEILFPGAMRQAAVFPVAHPLIQAFWPRYEQAFSEKPVRAHVSHPATIPTPYVIYAPAPGLVRWHDGLYDLECYHNAQQFRHREDLGPREDRELRIFITGGSTAWGCMAEDMDATISAFLEEILAERNYDGWRIRVVNAATGGWVSTQERIWIINRISEFEPDIVISYSGANDIFDMCVIGQDLFSAWGGSDARYYYMVIKLFEERMREEAAELLGRAFRAGCDLPRQTLKNVAVSAGFLDSIGSRYVYVFQPIRDSEGHLDYEHKPAELVAALERLAETVPFTMISHLDLFKGREHLFYGYCHFGDIGNRIIAGDLADRLDGVIREAIAARRAAATS